MLYHLLPGLVDVHVVFNVFVYITFRAAGAVVTSLLIAFVLGPVVIRRLEAARVGQIVRSAGPASHHGKAGTPTMGGVIIIGAAATSTLLWAELTNWYTLVALVSFLWMGAIGFLDDYLKVVEGKTRGLVARYKMVGQWTFGLALGVFLLWNPISPHPTTWTTVPFFSDLAAVFAPPVFVLFTGAVVSGSSNAVNLTDGLDGLAAGLTAIAAATLGVFAYIAGRIDTSAYLGFFYLPGAGELTRSSRSRSPARRSASSGSTHTRAGLHGRHRVARARRGARGDGHPPQGRVPARDRRRRLRDGDALGGRPGRLVQVHPHALRRGPARVQDGPRPPPLRADRVAETKVVIRFWILGVLFAMLAISTLKIR
jgi:UDP-N-acetylmuramyl pentapeptide phosphotransferase/UDP-N-acetylglucosamine-1-phosphate transferase